MTDMFELATRKKLRFSSVKGQLSVEQLWDLPLITKTQGATSLDLVAKEVNRELKAAEEESFVEVSSKPGVRDNQLRMKILKYIISVKQAEAQEQKEAAGKAAMKEKLKEVLERKQNQKLEELSEADIQRMLASL